jgi:hypothetical protein
MHRSERIYIHDYHSYPHIAQGSSAAEIVVSTKLSHNVKVTNQIQSNKYINK